MSSISIHAPHARGDMAPDLVPLVPFAFQSTPLMRGATADGSLLPQAYRDFNPRPSCEGRR